MYSPFNPKMKSQKVNTIYTFEFPNRLIKKFTIDIDPHNWLLILPQDIVFPDWAKLEHEKCICCTLSEEADEFCPAAKNIVNLVNQFKDMPSFSECKVSYVKHNRTISSVTSLSDALSSLFIIALSASLCPVLSLLKPAAQFFVPFGEPEEYIFQIASLFLLGDYFHTLKKAQQSNVDLNKFKSLIKGGQIVLKSLYNRIKNLSEQDAERNAMNIINGIAQIFTFELAKELATTEQYFSAWIQGRHGELFKKLNSIGLMQT